MPDLRLVDPEAVISYLENQGWSVVKRNSISAALLHPQYDYAVIVPVHDFLRPTEIADIFWYAQVDMTDFDDLIQP